MFIPQHYKNSDLKSVIGFIRENAFGILTTAGNRQINATHIPFEIIESNDKIILQGHVSRANPQWKDFGNGEKALVIFPGPHTYVSSSWYNHVNVPTWNYIAVHASGPIEILSETELYRSLEKLTSHYEKGRENAVSMEQLPEEMINKYLKGIVGFNLHVEKLEGKWKLSQNRNKEDFENIITELEKVNEINAKLVAEEMRKLQ